jgi:membrane-associated phospholipid phosphatase
MALSARRGLAPTDRVMLAFLAVNTGVVLWRAPVVESWPWLLLGNALALVLIALLQRAPDTRFTALMSGGYGVILTLAYYTQLGVIAMDVGQVHDALVQRWEAALFGGQVSVTWHARMPSLTLSWVLHFCYGSFYGIVAATASWLFFRAPRAAYERGMFLLTLAFYICYVVFALLPVAGPRYVFGSATGPITTVLPARLVHGLLQGGSAYGTAFPSSHVTASWCAVLALWRDARRLFFVLAPIAIGLALGTVYGQFHYGVDAIAGAALALVLFAVSEPLRAALRPAAPPS